MSQGELHALALALFLPRASLNESPFRFVVLDDPVQAMDPAKVDGLVALLSEIAETRQVVVFAHDGQAYWVAGELMRWPPLGEGEWAAALGAMRAEVSAESRARPPTVLWRIVMELTYGGNMT